METGKEPSTREVVGEIDLADLDIGDEVIITTSSGNSYNIQVTDRSECNNQTVVFGIINPGKEHGPEGRSGLWDIIEPGSAVRLLGGSEKVISMGSTMIPINQEPVLREDTRALIQVDAGGEDIIIATSPIRELALTRNIH